MIFATAALSTQQALAETLPTWTDTTGKFSIVAEFVGIDSDKVVLKKSDGTEVRVPLLKLSSNSRVRARKAAKETSDSGTTTSSFSPEEEVTEKSDAPLVPFPEGMTCEQTVSYMFEEPAKGNHRVLIDGLPAKHRTDVTEVIRLAGKQIDLKLFSEVESTSSRALKILRSKKNFILGCSILKQYSDKKYIPVYDAGVNMVAAVLATKVINPKKMQTSEPATMLGAYLKGLMPASENLMKAVADAGIKMPQQNALADFKNQKFSVETKSESEATVTVEIDGEKQASEWIRVDGRWVNAAMVADWDNQIQKAKDYLNALTPQSQALVLGQLKAINTDYLSKFEKVKSQQEFDGVVIQIALKGAPLMQQMMRGGNANSGMAPGAFQPPSSGNPGQPSGGGSYEFMQPSGGNPGQPSGGGSYEFMQPSGGNPGQPSGGSSYEFIQPSGGNPGQPNGGSSYEFIQPSGGNPGQPSGGSSYEFIQPSGGNPGSPSGAPK